MKDIELFNDHFQNFKSYGIPKAQLIIADVPYNLGANAYASNPAWYVDGDNRNGESELAGKQFFDTDKDFRPAEFMHFCSQMLRKDKPLKNEQPTQGEGKLRELPVTDGWIVTDDNLLACSPGHIDEVFAMLARQPHRPQFVGGLEAALMTPEMAVRLRGLKPESMFFAYDTPNDLEPLQAAGKMLLDAGFTKASNVLQCYVLIGYPGDTQEKALARLGEAWRAGFLPFAMLYRDKTGDFDKGWRRFQREWANRKIVPCNCKKYFDL